MTREEMQIKRELKRAIEKELLKPVSFHVNAAFVPHSFRLEEWKIPITAVEEAESALERAFADANEKIAGSA